MPRPLSPEVCPICRSFEKIKCPDCLAERRRLNKLRKQQKKEECLVDTLAKQNLIAYHQERVAREEREEHERTTTTTRESNPRK